MTRIKLSLEDIGLISLFEKITKANVKDCIVDDKKSRIVFVVNEGQAGMAIGKGGANIKRLELLLKKKVEVLEFSEDPIKFVSNIFRPVKISNGYVSEKSTGTKSLYISVGKGGNLGMIKSKIKNAKEMIDKYFKFDEVNFQ